MNLTTKIKQRILSLLFTTLFISSAWAAAPQQKFQAPGFYRMMLGQFEITALHDGTIDLEPSKLLTNTTPKKVEEDLDALFQGPVIPVSVNAFLINTGEKLVLIDSGTGPSGIFGPSLGQLLKNLTASGYSPEQVDEVYFTHIHPDHVGGLITPAGEAFPNAIIRLDQRELSYWTDVDQVMKAPEDHRPFFPFAESALKPYKEAGRLKPFAGNAELISGIQAISAVGHTLGHTVYKVESEGQRMLVWGDVIHVGTIQFAQPQVTIVFDTDSPTAAKARAKIFAEAATDRVIIAAAHQPFPGLGHLLRAGTGYQFVPYPYGGVK
ncbi:MBL fold metallo-hydrolase [Nitrosomonas sp. PY1]|uniref:MBL fold metallo-hydrolase n=1 Tax=Nitrosomonas sp. PY1 TaxID=1803906 RepID=UPI001FC7CC49|nr:MBL fold metallo-hydrolase [Nitrosomonas sp. PY1]GKS68084.1 MBL fold metallo-hydrolase [Nitrosomonas sp. PY1]